MISDWKYTNSEKLAVIRYLPDGSSESCDANREDVVAWVAAGDVIADPDV